MNHPTREEWTSYLYDELTTDQRSGLDAHLAVCPECKAGINAWRGVQQDLDAWRLPARSAPPSRDRPLVRWAAAATIVLGLGFGFGRISAPASASAEHLRAAIEPSLRQQLKQEFAQLLRDELNRSAKATLAASGAQTRELLGDFARVYDQNRTEDNRAVSSALEKLDSQRLADVAALKRDLDTVAVFSEAGLMQTQRQLVQLASYSSPADSPSNLPQN